MNIFNINQQEVLERISRHCPEALSTYLHCINRSKNSDEIYFSKHQVEVEMSEEWIDFKQNIKKLARENLISWHPNDNDGVYVNVVDIDDNG